mgnify:CR=1 FL=1
MSDTKLMVCGSIAIDRIMNFNGSYKDLIKPDAIHVLSLSVFLDSIKDTPIQNCMVHKLRNVLSKTSHKHKKAMAEDLKVISDAQSPDEALLTAKEIAKKWYTKEAKAIASLRHNFEYCLTYFQYPKDIWKKIRSTNVLEREFREVRRRTKVNDHSFNSFVSANMYHEGIFQYLNSNYPEKAITTKTQSIY